MGGESTVLFYQRHHFLIPLSSSISYYKLPLCICCQSINNFYLTIMKLNLSVVLVAAFLSACASTPKFDYVKEAASSHQKTDALSECQYQVKLNKTPVTEQQELIRLCMQGKGFRLKRVG
jgi:hypothetical protein